MFPDHVSRESSCRRNGHPPWSRKRGRAAATTLALKKSPKVPFLSISKRKQYHQQVHCVVDERQMDSPAAMERVDEVEAMSPEKSGELWTTP